LACTVDPECLLPNPNFPNDPRPFDLANSGECVGPEPVNPHRNLCQCECEEVGGARSRPGDFYCWQHLATTVEANPPCDELDPTLYQLSCSDRGSMLLRAAVFDADAIPGTSFSVDKTGNPPSCRQIAQNNLGSLGMAGQSMNQDGGAGDQVATTRVRCQGPGYDLGP
jgi:hypothetical protein